MRNLATTVMLLFTIGFFAGTSLANKVLCIHAGQNMSYVHVEKGELSDLTVGEVHIDLVSDVLLEAQKQTEIKKDNNAQLQGTPFVKTSLKSKPTPYFYGANIIFISLPYIKSIRLLI